MLATLNLQLLPAEIPDETLQTSAFRAPEGATAAAAGFADLLQLRVDASVALPADPGERLPAGGSNLPPEPDALPTPLLADPAVGAPAPEPLGQLISATGLRVLSGAHLTDAGNIDADISLAAEIAYQPAAATPIATAALPVTSLVHPTAAVTPTAADAAALLPDAAARSLSSVGRLPVTSASRPGEPITRESVTSNLRNAQADLVAVLPPERQAADAVRLPAAGDAYRSAPLPELPLRPTVAVGADRGDVIAQELAPLLRARPVVAQPAQALHAQLNLQQPAPLLATPAPAAVGSDLGYTAAAQQATDLISTSVRDSVWGERVGERVVMMAGNQLKSAEIRLTPAELGPLRVQVAIDDGAAHVTFHAQHAVTRDALEQALPRLREMLAENGLTLGNAEVGDAGVRQGRRDPDGNTATAAASGGESVASAADQGAVVERRVTVARGLIDTFA